MSDTNNLKQASSAKGSLLQRFLAVRTVFFHCTRQKCSVFISSENM